MGVKKLKKHARELPSEERAPVARPASARPTDPRRDADRMNVQDLAVRPLPRETMMGRANKFQVIFGDGILEDIRDHGLSSPEAEVCGVLVGNIYRDNSGPYCYVHANIRGEAARGRNAQVTFTSETWTLIHQAMDTRYPDHKIVGWYHTHPGFGIFLSEMDLFIQENFFNEPWQVAFVDDPKDGDRGVFIWQNGLAVRRQHLVDADPSKTDNRTIASLDPISAAARIRTIQRKLDVQKKKFRWFLLFAIVWHLALIAGLIWTDKVPVAKIRSVIPAEWNTRIDAWIARAKGQ